MAKRITKGNLWGFIQSRSYASVADMRRLFMMDVDGAAAVPTSEGICFIGLPPEAADMVGQLSREGRIGLDLNLNVKARVVQGVYPVRMPAPRHASAEGGAPKKRKRRRGPGGGAGEGAETGATRMAAEAAAE